MRKTILMTTLAAGALSLAACANGSSGTGNAAAGGSSTPAASSSASPSTQADLATTRTSLGTVVVDGKGMTVYEFDKDTVGAATTACTGVCVGLWPQVTATSDTPTVQGVTGQLGTAPNADGSKQMTLDGHRLYTFSGDTEAGQVNGQSYMNLWWVVSPAGQLIKGTAAAASSAASSASSSSAGGPSY